MGEDRSAAARTREVFEGRAHTRAQSCVFRRDSVGPAVGGQVEGFARRIPFILHMPASSAGMGGPGAVAKSLANAFGGAG